MAVRKNLAVIERALLQLPERCRYHGDQVDRGGESWVGRPCCDTGFPSLLRREALAQLAVLNDAAPAEVLLRDVLNLADGTWSPPGGLDTVAVRIRRHLESQ